MTKEDSRRESMKGLKELIILDENITEIISLASKIEKVES